MSREYLHCGFVIHPAIGRACNEMTYLVLVTNHTGYDTPLLTKYPRCEVHLGPTITEFVRLDKEENWGDQIWAVQRA